ncbi:hypothetical protein IPM19_03655 [bacterium]|nr:MAG: hypothetical protein IPM19_03655 [bacterium]
MQKLEVELGTSHLSIGDPVILRPRESRSREYPPFMEEQQFFVDQIKPAHPCTPHSPRIFIKDAHGQYVVERALDGRIINGRFDSADFIPAKNN